MKTTLFLGLLISSLSLAGNPCQLSGQSGSIEFSKDTVTIKSLDYAVELELADTEISRRPISSDRRDQYDIDQAIERIEITGPAARALSLMALKAIAAIDEDSQCVSSLRVDRTIDTSEGGGRTVNTPAGYVPVAAIFAAGYSCRTGAMLNFGANYRCRMIRGGANGSEIVGAAVPMPRPRMGSGNVSLVLDDLINIPGTEPPLLDINNE